MPEPKKKFEPLELDVELLRELPAEGAKMGLQSLGATVKHLRRKEKFEGIGPDRLSGRLKLMRDYGLTVDVVVLPMGDGKGWQRTPKGDALLKDKQ